MINYPKSDFRSAWLAAMLIVLLSAAEPQNLFPFAVKWALRPLTPVGAVLPPVEDVVWIEVVVLVAAPGWHLHKGSEAIRLEDRETR